MKFRALDEDRVARETAKLISAGKIIGWFQGRAEWGPRALGNRSILADPRRAEMKYNPQRAHQASRNVSAVRPIDSWKKPRRKFFDCSNPSPFMTFAYAVRPEKRDAIPAPTHVDGTGRLQTVSRTANPRYWRLIREFGDLTGVPWC